MMLFDHVDYSIGENKQSNPWQEDRYTIQIFNVYADSWVPSVATSHASVEDTCQGFTMCGNSCQDCQKISERGSQNTKMFGILR